jgi:hypothetical protein
VQFGGKWLDPKMTEEKKMKSRKLMQYVISVLLVALILTLTACAPAPTPPPA